MENHLTFILGIFGTFAINSTDIIIRHHESKCINNEGTGIGRALRAYTQTDMNYNIIMEIYLNFPLD